MVFCIDELFVKVTNDPLPEYIIDNEGGITVYPNQVPDPFVY